MLVGWALGAVVAVGKSLSAKEDGLEVSLVRIEGKETMLSSNRSHPTDYLCFLPSVAPPLNPPLSSFRSLLRLNPPPSPSLNLPPSDPPASHPTPLQPSLSLSLSLNLPSNALRPSFHLSRSSSSLAVPPTEIALGTSSQELPDLFESWTGNEGVRSGERAVGEVGGEGGGKRG